MITATWRGTRPPEIGEIKSPRKSAASPAGAEAVRDFKQLRLFLLRLVVDVRDVPVRDLLELFFAAFQVVLGNVAVLFRLAQLVVGVPAHVAHSDAGVFGLVVEELHQLLAPLFGESRDRKAHRLAVDCRVEPQV